MTTIRSNDVVAERLARGVLDTSALIDIDELDPDTVPVRAEITTVTLAELHQGIAMATDEATRAARQERLAAATRDFDPLVFDAPAAARYGTLVAGTLAAGRDPRRRRIDLMIAAIAASNGLPLFTRNADDFRGLEAVVTVVAV